ncbi:type II secretion system protein GspK [uncultured Tateyamaria sp.]|uniref:general secretion pathway protein GspK n=1 Tax=uncultured Tateyamaria sp. TaxID=455651 RepID=UPI0026299C8E|nr:type II secretion system protein GspK [uncultured Tateyamaria sp.]
MTRNRQSGVSLLNVLAVLAVGTGLVQIMLRDQDAAVQRLDHTNSAAQAHALAKGGITSVAVALQRDFQDSPDIDHLGEPWAQAAQDQIALDFGKFEVSIEDARGKFDLNALGPAALAEIRVFEALLVTLDLPRILAGQITQIVLQNGPLTGPEALLEYGIAQSDVDRLNPHVTATVTRGTLNLNTVTAPLMAALLRNPSAARGLIARRAAQGWLEARDLAALGVVQPPISGYTSDTFDVTTVASVGEARARLTRRLVRDTDTGEVHRIALP